MSFYHKIMIFGRPGSGKSTFAAELAQAMSLPLYHLDKYFYQEGWVERPTSDFMRDQERMVQQDSWIIDGNSTRSLETRWQRADLVLYFNRNRWLCLYRIFKRLFFKDPLIADRAKNCPEVVRFSLLKYLWTFESRVNNEIQRLKKSYPNAHFYEIKSAADLLNIRMLLKS